MNGEHFANIEKISPSEKLGEVDFETSEVSDVLLLEYLAEKLNIPPAEDGKYNKNVQYMATYTTEMTEEEALAILTKFVDIHEDDYNLLLSQKDYLKALLVGEKGSPNPESYSLDLRIEGAILKHWSPYIEVRAVTDCYDDMDESCETIRSYAIGLLWMLVGCFVNQFFIFRFPSISIGSDVLQMLTYPCGVFLAKVLPDWGFSVRGQRITLNPGPWTRKEQMFATFFLSGGDSNTYVSAYNLPVQLLSMYYDQQWATFG